MSGFPEAGLINQKDRVIPKKGNKIRFVRIRRSTDFFNLGSPALKMAPFSNS